MPQPSEIVTILLRGVQWVPQVQAAAGEFEDGTDLAIDARQECLVLWPPPAEVLIHAVHGVEHRVVNDDVRAATQRGWFNGAWLVAGEDARAFLGCGE